MGGESLEFDIAHFPKTGQQLLFTKSETRLVDDQASRTMSFADWLADPSNGNDGP